MTKSRFESFAVKSREIFFRCDSHDKSAKVFSRKFFFSFNDFVLYTESWTSLTLLSSFICCFENLWFTLSILASLHEHKCLMNFLFNFFSFYLPSVHSFPSDDFRTLPAIIISVSCATFVPSSETPNNINNVSFIDLNNRIMQIRFTQYTLDIVWQSGWWNRRFVQQKQILRVSLLIFKVLLEFYVL